jgi:ribosome maturation factor RimP
MSSNRVKDICSEKLTPVIESLGYELVEVFYGKQQDGMNLIFFIDSPNGITIDDCEKVHRTIDPILDEINPTNDAHYILSVSSLGLDRPIKTDRDFARNMGKEIEITLFAKQDGKKTFKGVLTSYDDQSITIDNKGLQTFDRKKVAHVAPVINF